MAEHAIGPHEYMPYFAEKGKYPGILGWLLATDHKRIGILYLFSVITFFFVAVFIGVLMRINMIPGHPIMTAQQYNAMFTLHGIIQIFLVVIPAVPTIFGNFFLPILIGGRDMIFPRLNLFT
jgi:cytochrome c oxidase subunit 1